MSDSIIYDKDVLKNVINFLDKTSIYNLRCTSKALLNLIPIHDLIINNLSHLSSTIDIEKYRIKLNNILFIKLDRCHIEITDKKRDENMTFIFKLLSYTPNLIELVIHSYYLPLDIRLPRLNNLKKLAINNYLLNQKLIIDKVYPNLNYFDYNNFHMSYDNNLEINDYFPNLNNLSSNSVIQINNNKLKEIFLLMDSYLINFNQSFDKIDKIYIESIDIKKILLLINKIKIIKELVICRDQSISVDFNESLAYSEDEYINFYNQLFTKQIEILKIQYVSTYLIQNLDKFNKLKELYIFYDNNFSDISSISNIEILEIYRCSELKTISNLKNVKKIIINNCICRFLETYDQEYSLKLYNLPNLEYLEINTNILYNIKFDISKFPKLINYKLNYNSNLRIIKSIN